MRNEVDAKEALRTLYEAYSDDIYRFARHSLGDTATAKDVVQEVFLRAFRSWHAFREEANPKTWLMSMSRNYIYDVLRKKRTERKYLSEYSVEKIHDSSSSVETAMILDEALTKLKDTYRQVFVLRHIQSCSVQETAQILQWSESKVKTTDQRAIAKLREILDPNSEEVTRIHER